MKMPIKLLTMLVFALVSFPALSSDRASFLVAWEKVQQDSTDISRFEKIGDKRYQIEFVTLPFEGELVVLAYDVEDISTTGFVNNDFTKTGYVEVDLVDAPDDLMTKYNRTYYKWIQSNTLYYNNKTDTWVSAKEYGKQLQSLFEEEGPGGMLFLLTEYWGYLLLALFIYIAYTLFFSNKHVKQSIEQQKQALDDMDYTKQHLQEALELHRQTNEILNTILEELKRREP